MSTIDADQHQADRGPKRVLYLLSIWPEAEASAASHRSLLHAAALKRFGYELVLAADEREKASCAALRDQGYRCERLLANDASIESFLREFRPELVIFDRFATEEKYSWRIREICPEAVRILDTIDLHFLRAGRQALLSGDALVPDPTGDLALVVEEMAAREVAAIYRSDLSLLVSDYERDYLQERCQVPLKLVHLYRLAYPPPPESRTYAERIDFGMIGNLKHAPNQDALHYMKRVLWPKIRKVLPEAKLHIWGAHPKPEHLAAHDASQGFLVHGRTPQVHEALAKIRVNLAPLRFGAGIKGKIADGWWVGTPVVTTPLGAEGMFEHLPFGGVIASDPEAFAEAAIELYQNQGAWQRASNAGLEIMRQMYSEAATDEVWQKQLEEILLDFHERRRQNFTGVMLWQQGMRSAEYFSRWIEEKNKKTEQKTSAHQEEIP